MIIYPAGSSPLAEKGETAIYRTLISSEDIQRRVKEMALEISGDYRDSNPLFITLLKGAFIFSADLVRQLTIPHEIDFVTLSSYRNGCVRKEPIELVNHIRTSVENRDIILVDEIVDTGYTLLEIMNTLVKKNISSLRICTLLDKPAARLADVKVHYRGFEIPDIFVVGYGLDYMERYRNLPFIAELDPESGMDAERMKAGGSGHP